MKPHWHEEHIQHTFDAFCKKVLRNEARDYLDELARKRNLEISFSDLPVGVMAEQQKTNVKAFIAVVKNIRICRNLTQLFSANLSIALRYRRQTEKPSSRQSQSFIALSVHLTSRGRHKKPTIQLKNSKRLHSRPAIRLLLHCFIN